MNTINKYNGTACVIVADIDSFLVAYDIIIMFDGLFFFLLCVSLRRKTNREIEPSRVFYISTVNKDSVPSPP